MEDKQISTEFHLSVAVRIKDRFYQALSFIIYRLHTQTVSDIINLPEGIQADFQKPKCD